MKQYGKNPEEIPLVYDRVQAVGEVVSFEVLSVYGKEKTSLGTCRSYCNVCIPPLPQSSELWLLSY